MSMKHFAGLVLAATFLVAPVGAQSVDEIIARNVETRGGPDALAAVESARGTGTMSMGGMQAAFTVEWRRPDKFRMDFEIQGMTGIQAFDGENGWSVMPFMGDSDPAPMAGEELKRIRAGADYVEGELVNYREKGHTVELLGKQDVEGTEAYKLKLTRADGDVVYLYLDTEYCLVFKKEARIKGPDGPVDVVSTLSDYKEVGGVLVAHSRETSMAGQAGHGGHGGYGGHGGGGAKQVVVIDSMVLNVTIDDERFVMPRREVVGGAE